MSLRVGIVGAGRTGSFRAAQVSACPDIEITAVADTNRPTRDQFAPKWGARLAVADHRRLVTDGNVDLVYVASPPSTHRTVAVDALRAGRDVICEPPIATNISDAEDMLAAAEAEGRRLFVALSQRYDPVNQEIARLIESGETGFPFLLSATYIADEFDRLNDWHDWKGTWDVGGGGVLMECGSQIVDLLCFLVGEVQAVSAVCTRFAIEPLNKAEDTCMLGLEFAEDIGVDVLLTGAARYSPWPADFSGSALRLDVYGLNGGVQANSFLPRLLISSKGHKTREVDESSIKTDKPTDMLLDFIDCIRQGKEPLVKAEDAVYALRVVLAGYKSSQNKRRVELLEEV